VYYNADVQKSQILSENKNKSGIYRFTNFINGKTLYRIFNGFRGRMYDYYNAKYLAGNTDMAICKALLKYGYSGFSLEILEYCDPKDTIKREQYYMDLFKPEYNILKTAGSRAGHKHTKESKTKISAAMSGDKHPLYGKTLPEETKAKMAAAKIGNTNWSGKTHTEETKTKMKEAVKDKCKKIEVFDLYTNETAIYDSIREAARALSCAPSAIRYCLSDPGSRVYKGRYKIMQH
jgi:group I intron endonuclease